MPREPRKAEPVLPMQLRVGNRFTDDRGEWEIVGRPYATAGGKSVHAKGATRGRAGGHRGADVVGLREGGGAPLTAAAYAHLSSKKRKADVTRYLHRVGEAGGKGLMGGDPKYAPDPASIRWAEYGLNGACRRLEEAMKGGDAPCEFSASIEAVGPSRSSNQTSGKRDETEAGYRPRSPRHVLSWASGGEIQPALVTLYMAQRQAAGAANGTINRELAVLVRMLRLAYRNGKLQSVPVVDKLKEAGARQGFLNATNSRPSAGVSGASIAGCI